MEYVNQLYFSKKPEQQKRKEVMESGAQKKWNPV